MASPVLALASLAVLLLVHASAPQNLNEILIVGGNYRTFLGHLASTQVGSQIQNQLNNSFDGFTVFAPNDGAFERLSDGTFNKLNAQQQVDLIQYHVTPKYHNFTSIQVASNPIRTLSPYTFNISAASNPNVNQFNITTGDTIVPVSYALNTTFPLSVFALDTVLLPPELLPPPTSSPPPTAPAAPANGTDGPTADLIPGSNGLAEAAPPPSTDAAYRVGNMGWIGLVSIVVGLF